MTLITDPTKLIKVIVDAGELEDSITDKVVKVQQFVELQMQMEGPLPNPTSQLSTERSQSKQTSQPSANVTGPRK